jgi:hypothetical protein
MLLVNYKDLFIERLTKAAHSFSETYVADGCGRQPHRP